MRRTKLIATLGPATDAPGVLDALMAAGLDVARLNTSHTTQDDLARRLAEVREAAERAGRHVAVMLDLGGAKVRIGEMADGVVLGEGQRFELRGSGGAGEGSGVESGSQAGSGSPGRPGAVSGDATGAAVSHAGLARDVSPGDRLLLDDGRIVLRVDAIEGDTVVTSVESGGRLTSRKGVNVPGRRLSLPSITPRDLDDLAWALDAGIDLVAQSFVRSAADIEELRAAMGTRRVPIVAKIEKHEAVSALPEIVEAADAVMVARGDLGVEMPPEDVPVIQRRVVAACRHAGKPVVIATQMLESMTAAVGPTRAEASDVANAIFTQVDAVMLSGETAVGVHPARVLSTMDRIVRSAEQESVLPVWEPRQGSADDIAAAVSGAVCELARDLAIAAIVTPTQSGATARAVAAHRPGVPVVAAAPDARIARQLALVWGVVPQVAPHFETIDGMIDAAAQAAVAADAARPGDLIAVTGGVAVHTVGATNFIQVHRIPAHAEDGADG